MDIWIINGRCEDCLRREDEDPSERQTCGCWSHDDDGDFDDDEEWRER